MCMPRTGQTVRLSVALLGVASALVTQAHTRPRHAVSGTAAFAAPWKLIPAGSNRAHICSFFALRPFLTSALLSASVVSVCNMRTRRGGVGTKVNRQIGTKVPTPALALRGRKASHSDPAPDGVEVSEKSVSKLDEVESATLLLWPTPKGQTKRRSTSTSKDDEAASSTSTRGTRPGVKRQKGGAEVAGAGPGDLEETKSDRSGTAGVKRKGKALASTKDASKKEPDPTAAGAEPNDQEAGGRKRGSKAGAKARGSAASVGKDTASSFTIKREAGTAARALTSTEATEGAAKKGGGTGKVSAAQALQGAEADAAPPPSSPASSPSKKRVPIAPGSLPPPEGWRAIYDLVVELRAARDAPVDWAGCEVVGRGDEFHILIALMLSSQTKDQVVSETMFALKAWPRGGLSVDSVLAMTDRELDGLIAKVGFHNNKTKYIKQTAQILKDRYKGRVPQTAHELCALPGIGPKMAYIILSAAFDIVDGIGVDTHMHRIFNQLGWVASKTPEQTREQLEGWLPRPEWGKVNVLFVGLGQGTQQPADRHRLMQRCVDCSRPADALRLVHLLGADVSGAADRTTAVTPLIYAVRQRNLIAVETLLSLGVKHELRDATGRTALDHARETEQRLVHDALVAYAAQAEAAKKKAAKASKGKDEKQGAA